MGEEKLTRPATYNDLRQFTSEIVREFHGASSVASSHAPYSNRTGESLRAQLEPTGPLQASGPAMPGLGPFTVTLPSMAVIPVFPNAPALSASPTIATGPKPVPVVAARIPDIPRGKGNWRKVIEQWDNGLAAWPKENFTGHNRTVSGSKLSHRKTIAEEYQRSVPT